MLKERGINSPIVETIAAVFGKDFIYKSPYKGDVMHVDLNWLNKFNDSDIHHVLSAISKLAQLNPYGHAENTFHGLNCDLINRDVDMTKLTIGVDAFIRAFVECQKVQTKIKSLFI